MASQVQGYRTIGASGQRRAALLAAAALVLVLALSAEAAVQTKLISRNSLGMPANGDSTTEGGGSSLSADGHVVVFFSRAANLPGGDGSVYRAYARNTRTGKVLLLSKTSSGTPASGDVYGVVISADGRVAAFYGLGDGLPGADGTMEEVWVHNLKTGRTVLASKAANGTPANADSFYPSLSGNGRLVEFASRSGNLPGADGVNTFAYTRNLKSSRTSLISKTNGGSAATGRVYGQSLSTNGRFAVFQSGDPGLPGADGNNHIYLRDLKRHRVSLIDRNNRGKVAGGTGSDASISGNGRFVAFESTGANMPGSNSPNVQVYLRDRRRGRTILISQNSAGKTQSDYAYYGHPSGDGRLVAFESDAANLPGGNGSDDQIYLRDTRRHKTRLLSRAVNGDPANAYANYPSLSVDGRWATFYSGATNLGGNPSVTNVFRAGPLR